MSVDADSQSFKERMVAEIKKIQDELNELKNLKVSISKKPARKTTKRKTVKRKPARKTAKRKTAAKKKTVKRKPARKTAKKKVVRKASKSKKKTRRR